MARVDDQDEKNKTNLNTLEQTPGHCSIFGSAEIKSGVGQIGLGRWNNCQRYLQHWLKWIGPVDPAALNGVQLSGYQQHLLDTLGATDDAHGKLAAVKQFYNWMYEEELLASLPRNFKRVNITVKRKAVKILEIDYIKTILASRNGEGKIVSVVDVEHRLYTKRHQRFAE